MLQMIGCGFSLVLFVFISAITMATNDTEIFCHEACDLIHFTRIPTFCNLIRVSLRDCYLNIRTEIASTIVLLKSSITYSLAEKVTLCHLRKWHIRDTQMTFYSVLWIQTSEVQGQGSHPLLTHRTSRHERFGRWD